MPADATAPQPLNPLTMPPVGRRWRDVPDAVQGSKAAPVIRSDADHAAAERLLAANLAQRRDALGW